MGKPKATRYPSYEDPDAGRIPGSEYAPPFWDDDEKRWYDSEGKWVDGPDGVGLKSKWDRQWSDYGLLGFWDKSQEPPDPDDHSFKDQPNTRYDLDLLNLYTRSHGLPKRQAEIVTCLNKGWSLYKTAKHLGMTASNVTRSLRRLTKTAKAWVAGK